MFRHITLALLLALTSACGTSEPTPPSPAPAAEPTPEAAPKADKPKADKPKAKPAKTVGHCADGERSMFHCEVANSKHISLCKGGDMKGIQYRFGPLGKPELVFPENPKKGRSAFTYAERNLARASERSISFTNNGVTYDLFEVTGGSDDSGAGVYVTEGEKVLTTFSCQGQTWTEDFDGLQKALTPK